MTKPDTNTPIKFPKYRIIGSGAGMEPSEIGHWVSANDYAALLAERDDLRQAVRHANDHADSAIDELQTALNALDGLLIALSTGKGIAEATDTAKAVMRRDTQGDTQ